LPGLGPRTLARAAAGFALGLALWWGATPWYDRLLAGAAEPVVRFLERPAATRLYAEGREIVIDRSDFPSNSARPGLPADDLTFNVGLFVALAATVRGLARDRGPGRFLLALALLFATHAAAVVVNVEFLYATQLGPWSEAHYGAAARNFWGTAAHFYRVVGIHAVALLLWWGLLRGEPAPSPDSGRAGSWRGAGRASRRRGRG